MLYSGEYAYQIGLEKERSLHAYRDQQRLAERDMARIFDREGGLHAAWRTVARRPRYRLRAPEQVQPSLDVRRLPPTQHLKPTDEPPPIEDPTRRTLEQTLARLPNEMADFQ